MTDTRVVYGAGCTWWDSIDKVGELPNGLPCCPYCGSVLFETDSEKTWWGLVDRTEQDDHPGYRAFVEWLRGKCFPSYPDAVRQFELGDTNGQDNSNS